MLTDQLLVYVVISKTLKTMSLHANILNTKHFQAWLIDENEKSVYQNYI